MNILMVGLYPPHRGGVATHLYNLTRKLEKKHNVYVLTYGKSTEKNVFSTAAPTKFRGWFFLVSGGLKISQIVRKYDIELIHAHYILPPGFVGLWGKKMTDAKFVISAHGSDVNTLMKKWYGRIVSEYVLKRSDYLIANSESVAKILRRYNRTTVAYNGVDTQRFYPKGYEREGVTYIGALMKKKGVDTLLNAWNDAWIVGGGPERSRLESLGGRFFGYRDDPEEILNRSKVLVLPSHREGFGMVLLEAMACGTPVIARDIPSINEIVEDEYNGLLFKKDAELKNRIERIVENEDLRKKLIKNGLETVKKFSWEKTVEKVLEVYSTVCE
jgi:glycosyltransferase involved in cell wall biosynthesis